MSISQIAAWRERERRGKGREKEEGADEHKPDCCMGGKGEDRERKRARGGCR